MKRWIERPLGGPARWYGQAHVSWEVGAGDGMYEVINSNSPSM